jgi:hypothetical protein
MRNAYTIFVGKTEFMESSGRPRHRSEDKIKLHLKEIGLDFVHSVRLAQNIAQWRALLNTALNLRGS